MTTSTGSAVYAFYLGAMMLSDRMFITVLVIFVLCWTPPAMLCVLTPLVPDQRVTMSMAAKASSLLNSCLNPLVYTLHRHQFWKNITSLLSYSKRKMKTKWANLALR